MQGLKNKVILICGGGSGIGAETARRLAAEGAQVAIGDINLDTAQSVASAIVETGQQAIAVHYDQADEASIQQLFDRTIDHFGKLDGVFANAADLSIVFDDQDILHNDVRIWERSLSVNMTGTALIIRAALPLLLKQGGGSIVCTSSSASTVGEEERPAYAASKAGINALCRHVASRWGRENIRCNAVAPGFIITETIQKNMPQKMLDKMLRHVRSPRHGATQDIAAAVTFLLSNDGEWVNGQVWHVNGGVTYSN